MQNPKKEKHMKHVHPLLDHLLMILGLSSFGAYKAFQATSAFCRELCPIITVATFLFYIVINWDNIKKFFRQQKIE